MSQDPSFAAWMCRLRNGDPDAARHVFDRFSQRLIALARTRLNPRLRPKVDPEDVLQSVCNSFFLRYAGGQFELGSWDSLWGLLTLMTVRRCGRWADRFQAAGRDIDLEVPLQAGSDAPSDAGHVLAREPTPSESAMLAEVLRSVMAGLEEHERHILSLSLQGYEVWEVSDQVGYSERTVQRVLQRVRSRLERSLA
jgi:RNA polymerase sigma-70 factor, ECF subfamily